MNDTTDALPTVVRAAIAETAQMMAQEIARQMGQHQLDALPLDVLAGLYDIPPSTLDAARRKERGPRVFTIGRRVYCRREDWSAWLLALAESGGTGPLNPPRRQEEEDNG